MMPMAAAATFSLLLVATGVAKLLRPGDTARALSMLGVPRSREGTFLLAMTEIAVGAAALVTGHWVALGMQTGLYAGFLAWVSVALARRIPIASCGCLGRDDTPPSWGHLILNGLAVVASLSAIQLGPVALNGALEATTQLVLVTIGSALAWAILGVGARAAGQIKT